MDRDKLAYEVDDFVDLLTTGTAFHSAIDERATQLAGRLTTYELRSRKATPLLISYALHTSR